MEEMILRMCVLVVSLLYIKDHAVIKEQDEDVIVGMQKREHLLQKAAAKLEQEVQSLATGRPHSNQEMSQSHHELTQEVWEESDIRQQMPNNKAEKLERPGEVQNALNAVKAETDFEQVTSLDHRDTETDQKFSSEEENKSILSGDKVRGQEDDVADDGKTDDQQVSQDSEMLNDVQAKASLNQKITVDHMSSSSGPGEGLDERKPSEEESKSFFHVFDFVPKLFRLHAPEEKVESSGGQERKELSGFDQDNPLSSRPQEVSDTEEDSGQESQNIYSWYLWKFLSLMSVIRLLRKFIRRPASKATKISILKDNTISDSTAILNAVPLPDHEVLNEFYDQCIRMPSTVLGNTCEFVEGFAQELLEAARKANNDETDMQIGDFFGVGSMYEHWATDQTTLCNLYVIITAPRSYGLDVKLCEEEKKEEMRRFGRIKMVKKENIPDDCPCTNGNLDSEDVLCLLHSHHKPSNVITEAHGGPLCEDNTSYLARNKVVRWFRSIVKKTWGDISHKFEFELVYRNQTAPGALKVRFRSGRVIQFNITPVVHVEGSDLYLVSHLSKHHNIPETDWPISFARYEQALLQHFSKVLPQNSCHIQCLQILTFLHKQQNILTGICGLTSYHLKSTLLHLLLMHEPADWRNDQLTHRLTDMLKFIEQRLQEKMFPHVLIGNALLQSDTGLPKDFQAAKPANIFDSLASDGVAFLKTVQHFQEMVKNAPVIIQEYGSLNDF